MIPLLYPHPSRETVPSNGGLCVRERGPLLRGEMLHDARGAHVEAALRVRVHRVGVVLVILHYWHVLQVSAAFLGALLFTLHKSSCKQLNLKGLSHKK